MHRFIILTLLSVTFLWQSESWAEKAIAIIHPTSENSSVKGKVELEDTDIGVRINARVEGVSPGKHGFHIHEFGSCDDGGKAAGGHYNPDGMEHGYVVDDGVFESHPGDLGNIEVAENGVGSLEVEIQDLSISDGLYNIGGRAFILHATEDDFGQPTGNAGGRIGCGAIIISN